MRCRPSDSGAWGSLTGTAPPPERGTAIALIRHAYERGCTFFDTAGGYGSGANEELVGEALAPIRDHVIIATKLHLDSSDSTTRRDLSRQLRRRLDASLARLGTDHVDPYYQHRALASPGLVTDKAVQQRLSRLASTPGTSPMPR